MHTHGDHTYGIAATHSNYLKIINNTIKATPSNQGTTHVPILLGTCHYNTISYNNLELIVQEPYSEYISLNGIYLSSYNAGPIDGGKCNYNNISHNTIKGYNNEWCRTIQITGDNNIILNNTVSRGYYGISSDGNSNQIINNTIHATNIGIYAGSNDNITGNTINLNNDATGIRVIEDNCIIKDNKITTTNKEGIHIIQASNNLIENNIIITKTGYGILIESNSISNNITKNTINTQSTGIFFRAQNKKNTPTNNIISNNVIDTTANYTIDVSQSNNTQFISNHLFSAKGTGNNTIKFSGTNDGPSQLQKIDVILNDTEYSKYFNEDGSLKNLSYKYTFNLTGNLNNKNITLSVPTTINGNQNTIYNGTIKILENGVETTIKNLNIINTNQIGIILYNTENVNIENNIIIVNQTTESYGIYLHGSYYNRLLNNRIISYGDYVNFGIFLYGSDNNEVRKNKVNTISSNIEIPPQTEVMLNENIGSLAQIHTTYGIIAVYSSRNNIQENIVNVTSLFKEAKNVTENCSNTMIGIDIYYNSHYNTVNNNQINVIGNNPYSYGMGVLGSAKPNGQLLETAKENKFENNDVTVFGNYFATGFIAGLGSIDTLIKNNTINVKSNTYTYGITFESSQRSNLISNNIILNSPVIYGIELYNSNTNKIEKNNINALGYYKYGIAGTESSENKIINNKITTKNTNIIPSIIETKHKDYIKYGDTGILLIDNSTYNQIKSNLIITDSEYTINLTNSKNNTITENSLVSKEKKANTSIFSDSTNTIENNEGHRLSINTEDIISNPGKKITLKAMVKSTSGNSDGLKVTFIIGLTTIGTTTTKNGIAELTYNIPSNWKCTYYPLKAIVTGEGYLTKSITRTLELKKPTNNEQNNEITPKTTEPNIETQKSEEIKTQTKTNKVTITLTKASKTVSKKAKKLVLTSKLKIGNKIANNKKLTFIIGGKKYTTKTNKKGIAKVTIKKKALKKLLKKVKVGKKIKYQIKYGKKTYTQYIKVKK